MSKKEGYFLATIGTKLNNSHEHVAWYSVIKTINLYSTIKLREKKEGVHLFER